MFTIYLIGYAIKVLYLMVTCAGRDKNANDWDRVITRGLIAAVAALLWPLSLAWWVIRKALAKLPPAG